MRTDEADFMRRWTPVVRQLAGPERTEWKAGKAEAGKLEKAEKVEGTCAELEGAGSRESERERRERSRGKLFKVVG